MKRKWDISSKDVHKKCVEEIITRIDEQQGSEFGIVAAEEIMDIVAQNIGPDIYNVAIKDVAKLLDGRFSDIQVALDLLKHQS